MSIDSGEGAIAAQRLGGRSGVACQGVEGANEVCRRFHDKAASLAFEPGRFQPEARTRPLYQSSIANVRELHRMVEIGRAVNPNQVDCCIVTRA
jgi:hypothetical protein